MQSLLAGTIEQLAAVVQIRVAVMQQAELLHVRARRGRNALGEAAIEHARCRFPRRTGKRAHAQDHNNQCPKEGLKNGGSQRAGVASA